MRLISWNINGIRAIQKKGFLDWLDQESPDILCVQEIKANQSQLDEELINPVGYISSWQSATKAGYSGTAVFCKKQPKSVLNLGIDEFDSEGRVQILEFDQFSLINTYFPNSQPERKRLDYKLRFFDAILKYSNKAVANGKNIIMCGDYNVAHTAIDLANPKTNENNAGYYIEERDAMSKFLSNGYVDTFRHFHKEPNQYTWWSYRTNARERNIGWRIDYFTVNETFMSKVKSAGIMPNVLGSDHCPISLEIDG
ncbi:MAG: exodeoxyribonuclease III [Candidatus Margulisbacteria bacterium GWF2_35_9]|nr:MAG: exodeoxyribonuclease III [Candidatus Margulisbacteria bacterium GWF2_35_9]